MIIVKNKTFNKKPKKSKKLVDKNKMSLTEFILYMQKMIGEYNYIVCKSQDQKTFPTHLSLDEWQASFAEDTGLSDQPRYSIF